MARTEYATLAQLKAFITMAGAVVDRDDLMTLALDAAHDQIERKCGRRFYLDGSATARDFDPAERVVEDRGRQILLVDDIGSLTDFAVATGTTVFTAISTAVEYRPENALTRGRAITGLLSASGLWPADPFTRVRVTARWGWPAVPGEIKEATLLQASRLYARRKSPQGVVGTAEWGEIRLSRADSDVTDLLDPFTKPGFA